MTNPRVEYSLLPPPPSGLTESVGWHVVPDEPPGTLSWWDGNAFVAVAFWAVDHWEYVTDEWAGSGPALGRLPEGAGDPQWFGFWQAPDGQWYPPPPEQAPSGGHPAAVDISVWFGAAGVGVFLFIQLGWILPSIGLTMPVWSSFLLLPAWLVALVFGVLALSKSSTGVNRGLGRVLGGVTLGIAMCYLLLFALLAFGFWMLSGGIM
jgi:hypothetical protein